jgi:hypothetical protein
MKPMSKKACNILLGIIILSIGICIGECIDYGYFELSKEVSIIEALSFFTTIGCAIYIAKILEKEVQDKRVEKDLYLKKIEQIEELLSAIEDAIDEEQPSYNRVVSLYSKCNIKRHKLISNLKSQNSQFNNIDISAQEETMSLRFKLLKPLLTETSIKQKGKADVVINKSKVKYSEARKVEISKEINILHDDFFMIKLAINNF